ncbi:MAG TPA: glucosaminidase domain-containing protein [Symbiobacteriaceae bacterium]|nr:glucosaminidase domain-containing protein [Symbiobacteriaceae bacterium]
MPYPIVNPFPPGPAAGEERLPTPEETEALQQILGLHEEGYGMLTRVAVATLQQKWGIPVDDEVKIGPRTWTNFAKLNQGEEVPAAVAAPAVQPHGVEVATGTDAEIHERFVAAASNQERYLALKPSFLQAEAETGVAWQIHAAQWSLESAWGTATPADINDGRESWNFFGIKAYDSWQGQKVAAWTWEEVNGEVVKVVAYFRGYNSVVESIKDHTRLLKTDYYKPVRDVGSDVAAAAKMLGPAGVGYATDSKYPDKLLERIAIFENW